MSLLRALRSIFRGTSADAKCHLEPPHHEYDLKIAQRLFDKAKAIATQMPEIGGTLADACDTINMNMVHIGRATFPVRLELVVGFIAFDGNSDYVFSAKDLNDWASGLRATPRKFPGHAWLNVQGEILDLTLWTTLHKHLPNDPRFFAPSFLTEELALNKGIQYTEVARGDHVLQPFLRILKRL